MGVVRSVAAAAALGNPGRNPVVCALDLFFVSSDVLTQQKLCFKYHLQIPKVLCFYVGSHLSDQKL